LYSSTNTVKVAGWKRTTLEFARGLGIEVEINIKEM
jgi:hypothetical protein